MAYSDERVTQPLRRKDDGTFEPIDWDTAFKEIGAKVQDIIAKNGPESLAIIQDPRPSGKQYSARFMNALGSANVYAHSSSCNLSKESAYPVSYTHLDVYKRQPFHMEPGTGATMSQEVAVTVRKVEA